MDDYGRLGDEQRAWLKFNVPYNAPSVNAGLELKTAVDKAMGELGDDEATRLIERAVEASKALPLSLAQVINKFTYEARSDAP